eukprot:6507824-Pyramimonas_sp.AAC.1
MSVQLSAKFRLTLGHPAGLCPQLAGGIARANVEVGLEVRDALATLSTVMAHSSVGGTHATSSSDLARAV